MWSRLRKKLLIHGTGVAERTGPIPKPNQTPGVVCRTAKQDVITLQEQMGLEDDMKTFLEFTSLIKQTMANHLNIGMGYKWQDPGLLEEVREEVLVQCPALEERYDDAWPIMFYMKLSLRQRTPLEAHQKRTIGRNSLSRRSQTNLNTSAVLRRLIPEHLAQKKSAGIGSATVELSSKRALRRSTRLTRREESIIKPTEASMAREENEDENSGEEEDGTSFRSEQAGNADPDAGSESGSDSEDSPPLRSAHGSLDSGCTSVGSQGIAVSMQKLSNTSCRLVQKTQENNRQGAMRGGLSSNCPRSVCHTPHRARSLSTNLNLPHSSPTLTTNETAHDATPGVKHFSNGLDFGSPSLASPTSTPQHSDIEDMLLSRGLPLTDSRRINHLLSSLGIVDKAYLRVFARLVPSREAWLSEMRRKGQLSEVQAWVIVDMLDTVVMD
ncbi:hypothetical protein VTO73DRAFT_7737 [Trametes versicolor]